MRRWDSSTVRCSRSSTRCSHCRSGGSPTAGCARGCSGSRSRSGRWPRGSPPRRTALRSWRCRGSASASARARRNRPASRWWWAITRSRAAAIALGLGGSLVLGGVAADWWDHRDGGGAAPLGLKGWQFAFLVAALPGFVLAALLYQMPEPQRGRLDRITSPPDPHPFQASLALLGAVTPGANWVALAVRRAGARYWNLNLMATILIVAAAVVLTRITSALSPRPPLHFGFAAVSPHALQWAVVGFGALVVVNLLQRLRLADRPTFVCVTRSPALLLCLGVAALQMMINYGTMGFTPSFLMKHYGRSEEH